MLTASSTWPRRYAPEPGTRPDTAHRSSKLRLPDWRTAPVSTAIRPILERTVPIVIPKWTAHGVADWDDLLVDNGDGRFELNEATAALLNYMPAIGITALTQETAGDAWCRIAIHQALFGALVQNSKTGQKLFLTKSDVFRHIGVETEGTQQSFSQFCESLLRPAQLEEESESLFFVTNGRRSLLQVLGVSKDKVQPDESK